ncbi:MAG: nucleotide sugar dehydrogenase [Rhodospirillaceae bacterium]
MSHKFETISVIGLGYVGLPTAATLASRDVKVIGVDIRQDAVSRINEGRSHILEPDLDIILQAVVAAGKLRAVTRPEPADAFLIAVPTPVRPDHTPDMHAVESATDSLIDVLRPGNLVVLESTSPVGTTKRLAQLIAERRPDLRLPGIGDDEPNIFMAYCPERILPGQTLRELIDNDRIIGGLDRASAERARELYSLFCRGDLPLTDASTAEMVKLTENAYRDVNIAFANEVSMVCDRARLDVWSVVSLANHPCLSA